MENERLWILIAKKKNNEANQEELAELELLLSQNDAAGYEHEVIEKIWENPLGFLPEMNLNESTWNNIEAKISSRKKTFSISHTTRWIAAAVFLMAVATFIFIYQKPSSRSAAEKNISAVITKPLSKQNFYLPDGTHVWLHGNSKIAYNKNSFGKAIREVNLIGEAFFDVTKNPKVPFVIHAGVINITVKGTAFNVKAYPGQKNIETTLLRGLIEITTAQNPDKKIYVKPNEKIIIPARITSNTNQNSVDTKKAFAITLVKINADKIFPETAWMKDKLEFNNETFEELAPEMESWFNVNIQFLNNEIKSKRFSGVIKKETLQQTLQALQLSYHFNYSINNNSVIIQ
jgi:ferric-dicitrate binding protein FerR (iron transport regulator)